MHQASRFDSLPPKDSGGTGDPMAIDWISIISGERADLFAKGVRTALAAASPFYAAAVALRSMLFDRRWRRVDSINVPVVSIGNLTTGGTGKTPLVAWTVDQITQAGARPAIVSRGYRGLGDGANDEKLVLDALCPGVPHVQNRNRVAASRCAISDYGCDMVVLDDGFQHRRLTRDLDVVLIDALNPWGYGALLPRGLLREPKSALSRADCICLTRADQVTEDVRSQLQREIASFAQAPVSEVAFVPQGLRNAAGEKASLMRLQSANVGGCCGIGNPEAFLRTLTALGAPPTKSRFRSYPDHYHFSPRDVEELAVWVDEQRIDLLMVTHKDLVKLPSVRIGNAELWALEIGVEFLTGEDELTSRLFDLIERIDNAAT